MKRNGLTCASYSPDTRIELGQLITQPRTPAERLGDGPLKPGEIHKLLVIEEKEMKFEARPVEGLV
jgi:hypothetical protein